MLFLGQSNNVGGKMKKLLIILIILKVASVVLGQNDTNKYVLIIGNSRGNNLYGFPSDSITKYLGYTKYKNLAVQSTTTPQIYAKLQNDIDSCGGDNFIGAVVLMDATNDVTLGVTPVISYTTCEAICKKVLQIVTPDNFYWFQSAPNKNSFAANDSAVITTSAANGSRSKALALWAREYMIATKYRIKYIPLYSYFTNDNPDSSDYPEAPMFSDGTHFTTASLVHVKEAFKKATTLTDMKIMWGGQNKYEGSWRGWYRPSATSVIVGDTGTGTIAMSAGDTVLSPVKGLGWKIKTVTVNPHLDSGSVKILVRYSDSYFNVNRPASSLSWLPYDSNVTEHNYCQFAIVAESNTTIDSCLYKWTNEDIKRSNYKQFGNRVDMVRDWHKDNFLWQTKTRSYGGQSLIQCYTGGTIGYCTVLKFGTDYDIPKNAIIDSAKVNFYNGKLTSNSATVEFYKLLSDWGFSSDWDEYEANQTPTPTQNQATFYRAKAPSVKWLSGDSIGASDYLSTLLDSPLVKNANAPVGTKLTSDVTNLVRACVSDTSKNFGWFMKGGIGTPANTDVPLYSQNADGAESVYRPYLEVWYTTVPPITITTQPRDTSIVNRGLVNFSVTATHPDSIHYQWIFNDSVYGGDTNYITATVDTSHDSSLVYCKVWSVGGDTVVSDTALLRVWKSIIIDSVGIYRGVLLKGFFPYTIDSVKIDDMDGTDLIQTGDSVFEFTPPFALMWQRDAFVVTIYSNGIPHSIDLYYRKTGRSNMIKLEPTISIGL